MATIHGFDCSDSVYIPDDFPGFGINKFVVPTHYRDDLKNVLIPKGLVDDRIDKLAYDICQSYGTEPLLAMCVLKGGYRFFADLMAKISQYNGTSSSPVQVSLDFVRLKSYQDDRSLGAVQIIGGDNLEKITGQNLLVVEDIIDTGRTMQKMLNTVAEHRPKCVKVASLLQKRTLASIDVNYRADFIGFDVPDWFVVGYALDYNEFFRDLNHVCVLNDHAKEKYRVKKD